MIALRRDGSELTHEDFMNGSTKHEHDINSSPVASCSVFKVSPRSRPKRRWICSTTRKIDKGEEVTFLTAPVY